VAARASVSRRQDRSAKKCSRQRFRQPLDPFPPAGEASRLTRGKKRPPMKLGIIVASTRPTRVGHLIGQWVHERAV
jgi:hypothetical protein